MLRICHLINGLHTGGAEIGLYKLLAHMNRDHFQNEVISLIELGPVAASIQELGIPVHSLHMKQGIPTPTSLWKLQQHLRRYQPSILQSWMYHSDLMGGLVASALRIPSIWCILQSNLSPEVNRKMTLWTLKTCAALSHQIPKAVICNAQIVKDVHVEQGYNAGKMTIIPNGYDLTRYQQEASTRADMRAQLKIPGEALVLGFVARFDPQKDHHNFVQMAKHVASQHPEAHFVLCGSQITWENEELAGWIRTAGLESQFHLLGVRRDVPQILSSLDLFVLSSCGEGSPTVVGEAMASAVPCVVTDVGDAREIIGDTGRCVPAKNSEALADACLELLSLPTKELTALGQAAKQKIESHYDIRHITLQYEALYRQFAK